MLLLSLLYINMDIYILLRSITHVGGGGHQRMEISQSNAVRGGGANRSRRWGRFNYQRKEYLKTHVLTHRYK